MQADSEFGEGEQQYYGIHEESFFTVSLYCNVFLLLVLYYLEGFCCS